VLALIEPPAVRSDALTGRKVRSSVKFFSSNRVLYRFLERLFQACPDEWKDHIRSVVRTLWTTSSEFLLGGKAPIATP